MAELIQKTIEPSSFQGRNLVVVKVDRHTLYKRRWRAVAENGTELAVDLDAAVYDGTLLQTSTGEVYQVEQIAEDVMVIPLPQSAEMGAKLGWYLGNQHLPVEVRSDEIILEKMATLAASLDRIGIPYTSRHDVFHCKIHSHQH
jgi:urease accessory protein